MADFNELITKDGTRKSISVRIWTDEFYGYKYIPSENILFESFKFTESVCSQQEFKFGCVEQSVVEFSLANYENITGKIIQIYFYVYAEDGSNTYVNLGRFKVTESKKNTDNANIRKVIAMTDIDAPLGIINVFKEIQRRLERTGSNYNINPELLTYGAIKNPYSSVLKYCSFDNNRYIAAVYNSYEKSDGTTVRFYANARIWERLKELNTSNLYWWQDSLFYFADYTVIDYLTDDILNRVNVAVDEIISESGLNPPVSFKVEVKNNLLKYLNKIQSFFQGLNRFSRYVYFIPSDASGGYPSPFVDAFRFSFNGIEKTVYIFGDTLHFRTVEIYDTRYDKIKDINVNMNLEGLDMSNDSWMKKLRFDWYEITGRMASNRINDMPFTAVPMDLNSDTLYPDDNIYPSDTLYPAGPSKSIISSDIKKLYVDDEEDINKFSLLKLSFKDSNNVEHTLTRPFYKKDKEDVLIGAFSITQNQYNGVDIYLEGYTSQRWILDSNVLKFYTDVSASISLEFMDKENNVIGIAFESVLNEIGQPNSDKLYYKHYRMNDNVPEYITAFHYVQSGYYVFESDKMLDLAMIRIKSYGSKIDVNYAKQHFKIFNEVYNEEEIVGNPYIIDGNMCLERFNINPGTIVYFADVIEEKLKKLNYTDISLTMRGLPNISSGNHIEVVTKNGSYDSYVMRRSLSGIQSLTDVIEAK